MIVTDDTTVAELDEAVTYLRIQHAVADRTEEVAIKLRLAEEIDKLLEHRHRLATAAQQ